MNSQSTLIEQKQIGSIRNKLITTLQFNLNGENGDVEKMLAEIDKAGLDIWDNFEGELDKDNMTEDYLNNQMVELSYNFSRERFELCQSIGKELFKHIEVVQEVAEKLPQSLEYNTESINNSSPTIKKFLPLLIIVTIGVILMLVVIMKD